jgi:hypothetical protein
MRRPHRLLLALTSVAAGLACAPEPVLVADDGRTELAIDGGTLRGVTRDPLHGRLQVLVENLGIVEIDDDGAVARTLAVGDKGLRDLPYRDIASLGDDRFLLIADNEGYLYDALTEQHRVHFCVEPGFVECFDENGELIDANKNGVCDWEEQQPDPGPAPAPIVQRNDALGLVGNEVVAAPRFYEEGTRVEATLRSYDASTGVATGAVDLSAVELDLAGLAPFGGALVGVGGDRLVHIGNDGLPGGTLRLEGVADATGVIGDGDGVLVLDAASRTLVRFTLPGEASE